jgi:hypothetical protein
MKTADEMRAISNEVNRMKREAEAEKVKKFVEGTLMDAVEDAANAGYTHSSFIPIPDGMFKIDIRNYLREFGYTAQFTEKGNRMVSVYW